MVQAKLFALYLNPARNPDKPSAPVLTANTTSAVPAVRPAAPSVRFKLCATSYYPNEPGRSMALISELGSPEGEQRWVKEGTQLRHFVIHEIRRGVVIYRDGDQLCETAIDCKTTFTGLVRSHAAGVAQAKDEVRD